VCDPRRGIYRNKRRNSSTYINPDALGIVGAVLGGLLDELSGDEPQHVLSPAQQPLAGGVVDASLGLVEALEGGLLAIGAVPGVRLQERGIEEAQEGGEGAGVLLILLGGGRAQGDGEDEADEEHDSCSDNEDLGVGILGQDARGKRSHGTLSLLGGGEGKGLK
jgi:hypothetical protein